MDRFAPGDTAVALAAWLHDVVYDPTAADNEQRSAEWAAARLPTIGVPAAIVDRVGRLVLTTADHTAPAEDRGAAVLLDADLAILGAAPDVYETYREAIRQEYGWLSDADFRAGRRQVLERLLQRQPLFTVVTELEAPARENVGRELLALGSPA